MKRDRIELPRNALSKQQSQRGPEYLSYSDLILNTVLQEETLDSIGQLFQLILVTQLEGNMDRRDAVFFVERPDVEIV